MKNLKVNAKFIIGVLFILSGIYSIKDIAKGFEYALTPAICFGIAFLIIKSSQKPKPIKSKKKVEEPCPVEQRTVTHTITVKVNNNARCNKNPHRFKVAGIYHYLDSLLELAEENYMFSLKLSELTEDEFNDFKVFQYEFPNLNAELIPEPINPYDPNAIKVVVNGLHIGYIAKDDCQEVKNLLQDDKAEVRCFIGGGKRRNISIKYDELNYNPSDELEWEEETTETDYFVNITIYTPITGGGNEEE